MIVAGRVPATTPGPACPCLLCLPGSPCPLVSLGDTGCSGLVRFMQVDKVPGPSRD